MLRYPVHKYVNPSPHTCGFATNVSKPPSKGSKPYGVEVTHYLADTLHNWQMKIKDRFGPKVHFSIVNRVQCKDFSSDRAGLEEEQQ